MLAASSEPIRIFRGGARHDRRMQQDQGADPGEAPREDRVGSHWLMTPMANASTSS